MHHNRELAEAEEGSEEVRKVKKPQTRRKVRQRDTLRAFKVGDSPINITVWRQELADYTDVLLGRREPPIPATSVMSLMEVADIYFARASEMTMEIQRLEREGRIDKANPAYRFRTGELRTFLDMAKRAADLGSRRLTEERLRYDMANKGRESFG